MEIDEAEKYVYARLGADTGAGGVVPLTGGLMADGGPRVFPADAVPEAPGDRYVTYQVIIPRHLTNASRDILSTAVSVLVTGWAQRRSSADLAALMDRVRARLHKSTGGTAAALIWECLEEPVTPPRTLTEQERDQGWRRRDAEYAVKVQPT